MSMTQSFRMYRTVAGISFACLALSACTSPTYGTGKSASEQLLDDLGNATSITGDQTKRNVKYNPRPGLVVPAQARAEQLAQPQQSLANRETNPQWPETPEEARERLRAEAEANKDNPNYRSPLLAGNGTNGQMTETQKWEAFRKAKADAQGGTVVNTNTRKYLTDPPVEYRNVSQDQLADLGEPELKKEKERKKNAALAGTGKSWWNPFQ
ncbi:MULTISPECIES: hypothetical protein [Rhizobium/Agrobacterium group]|jgi:hypothetical protein|uniref:Lipoprotein n=2 Tax=Rhizobium/Agrobacterium group TaxID=227290 RepID=A0AA92C3L4_RHIRH|nr:MULTISPECIES: hypothetical protein [Rhizobium/Agrobacterium group]KQR32264.1 hypothetical protein ASF91_11905 [Rhizobium sp. Leaf155]KQZ97570.1 hypothetical protein ASD74_10440 [Rhizobium sp. Root564]MDP9570051.1 hypothetical protein [Agrobacterium larrymoorei]MQB22356.1 hypothetical protein [Agrobacterium tumefaciens]PVE76685.1 hypothetical protein DCP16_09950 [Sphingomonas sp. TPD3009]